MGTAKIFIIIECGQIGPFKQETTVNSPGNPANPQNNGPKRGKKDSGEYGEFQKCKTQFIFNKMPMPMIIKIN
jgi:hypothetical protein